MDLFNEIGQMKYRIEGLELQQQRMEKMLGGYLSLAERTILSYESSIGRESSRMYILDDADKMAYANRCIEYIAFGREVDAALRNVYPQVQALRIGRTPPLYQRIGLQSYDMYITQKHLCNALHNSKNPHHHGLTLEQIRQLPELLEAPAAVIESRYPGTIVAILDLKNNRNETIIVPVRPNGNAYYDGRYKDANFVLSVYGKENLEFFMDKAIAEDRLIYLDKNKNIYAGTEPLRLRQSHGLDVYGQSIADTPENVNRVPENNAYRKKNAYRGRIL